MMGSGIKYSNLSRMLLNNQELTQLEIINLFNSLLFSHPYKKYVGEY